jgi:hypothetical protein
MTPQQTWGADPSPANSFLVPLVDEESFATDQARTDANVYLGDRLPRGSILELIQAQGDAPVGLEYLTLPYLLGGQMGPAGYTRFGSLHKFRVADAPSLFTLEKEFLQATAFYLKNRDVYINTIGFTGQVAGAARYTMGLMGSGHESEEASPLDGSPTNHGYTATNYFNGFASQQGVNQIGMTAFELTLDNAMTRQDAMFLGGLAAGINAGIYMIRGNWGMILEDTDFYNYAINDTAVELECMWANAPLALATQWLHIRIPVARFSRNSPKVGGNAGKSIQQDFVGELPSVGTKARHFSTIAGPYLIAASGKLGVKIDGGATQVINLTAGAARTATQIVADINTAAIANLTADVFMGRPRLLNGTANNGTASTLQVDTAQADSQHAVLGFDGTVVTGYAAAPIYVDVYNTQSSDYSWA